MQLKRKVQPNLGQENEIKGQLLVKRVKNTADRCKILLGHINITIKYMKKRKQSNDAMLQKYEFYNLLLPFHFCPFTTFDSENLFT